MTPLSSKISQVLQKRLEIAQQQLNERVQSAFANSVPTATTPWDFWSAGARYAIDFAQRSVLFWDTMRRRGTQFLERQRQGLPPGRPLDSEMVLDGRKLERRVNYALVRIRPPEGVRGDATRGPYVIT